MSSSSSSHTLEPLQASAAPAIASYSIGPANSAIQLGQTEHRINLINQWHIAPGSRILEIGCGQGDCTAVLASAVGPTGHIDAVDPAAPDYGAPYTLAQAQQHLSASAVGSRIAWHRAQPLDFLKQQDADSSWDVAVFAHCIWYFDSPEVLASMLAALKGRVKAICIAEYALRATESAAVPHVLSAIVRATIEAHNPASEANIRCLSSPSAIKDAAQGKGWTLAEEHVIVPGKALMDGHWETGTVQDKGFLSEIEEHIDDPKVKALLRSTRDAVIASMEAAQVTKAQTMDVWVARFN